MYPPFDNTIVTTEYIWIHRHTIIDLFKYFDKLDKKLNFQAFEEPDIIVD